MEIKKIQKRHECQRNNNNKNNNNNNNNKNNNNNNNNNNNFSHAIVIFWLLNIFLVVFCILKIKSTVLRAFIMKDFREKHLTMGKK